jgi:hypothetical protein
MKELSSGNIEYEKIVTDQFVETIPEDLHLLEKEWQNNQIGDMRKLAHNMKTTVSVMGLNEVLQPYLDAIEHDDLNEESFRSKFTCLKLICTAAVEEAKQFYSTL